MDTIADVTLPFTSAQYITRKLGATLNSKNLLLWSKFLPLRVVPNEEEESIFFPWNRICLFSNTP